MIQKEMLCMNLVNLVECSTKVSVSGKEKFIDRQFIAINLISTDI